MRQESSADFRERFVAGMRRAASGVAIVTCGEHGATVSAFSSVTDNPPSVMVCLHNSGRTRRAVASRRLFSVNLLASRHAPLADIFAGRTRGEKFADGEWSVSENTGAKVLKGAAARIDCRLAKRMVFGTHTIFVGEVLEMTSGKSPPLAYANRQFCKVSPLKNGAAKRGKQ